MFVTSIFRGVEAGFIVRQGKDKVWDGTEFSTVPLALLYPACLVPALDDGSGFYSAADVPGMTSFELWTVEDTLGEAARLGGGEQAGLSSVENAWLKDIFDKLQVIPEGGSGIIVPAPVPPSLHLVPVILDVRHGGNTRAAEVVVFYLEKSLKLPVSIGPTNEEVVPPFIFQKDAQFTALPGLMLYSSPYLRQKSVNGSYYAYNSNLNLNEKTGLFDVPELENGRTYYTLSELLLRKRLGNP